MAKSATKPGRGASASSPPKTATPPRNELETRIARLTKNLENERCRSEELATELNAAYDVIEESMQEVNGPKTEAEQQLATLRAEIADVERRKEVAEGIAAQIKEANELARRRLTEVTTACKQSERELRQNSQTLEGVEARLEERRQALEAVRTEIKYLEEAYGPEQKVDCGCVYMVRKGPDCASRAVVLLQSCVPHLTDDDLEIVPVTPDTLEDELTQ